MSSSEMLDSSDVEQDVASQEVAELIQPAAERVGGEHITAQDLLEADVQPSVKQLAELWQTADTVADGFANSSAMHHEKIGRLRQGGNELDSSASKAHRENQKGVGVMREQALDLEQRLQVFNDQIDNYEQTSRSAMTEMDQASRTYIETASYEGVWGRYIGEERKQTQAVLIEYRDAVMKSCLDLKKLYDEQQEVVYARFSTIAEFDEVSPQKAFAEQTLRAVSEEIAPLETAMQTLIESEAEVVQRGYDEAHADEELASPLAEDERITQATDNVKQKLMSGEIATVALGEDEQTQSMSGEAFAARYEELVAERETAERTAKELKTKHTRLSKENTALQRQLNDINLAILGIENAPSIPQDFLTSVQAADTVKAAIEHASVTETAGQLILDQLADTQRDFSMAEAELRSLEAPRYETKSEPAAPTDAELGDRFHSLLQQRGIEGAPEAAGAQMLQFAFDAMETVLKRDKEEPSMAETVRSRLETEGLELNSLSDKDIEESVVSLFTTYLQRQQTITRDQAAATVPTWLPPLTNAETKTIHGMATRNY